MGATKLMTAAGGGITLDAASTASDKTITVPAVTDTMLTRTTNVNSGTAVASTSGTSIDFTGIPSWVKRITVMFSGVSTNGTSVVMLQLGNGSFVTSGYLGAGGGMLSGSGYGISNNSSGFLTNVDAQATSVRHGSITISNITGNTWVISGVLGQSDSARITWLGGSINLGGTLDRVRITTVNGTDTFDAGSINILYE